MDAVGLKAYIIENNKYFELLDGLGFKNINNAQKYYSFSTPLNTKSTSTVLYKEDLRVKIFADNPLNIKGDIFNLISGVYDISFSKTVRWVHEILGLEVSSKSQSPNKDILSVFGNKRRTEIKEFELFYEKELDKLYDVRLPYVEWVREGILPLTQEIFGIGYNKDFNRVLIPHRYWKGNGYIGLVGRTLNKEHQSIGIAKYLPLLPRADGIASFPKTYNLYGLFENFEGIKKAGYITIHESEKSVMKRHSRLDYTGVSVGCHYIDDKQIEIIYELQVIAVIAFDEDVPLIEVLSNSERLHTKGIKTYYMYNYNNMLKKKEAPADLCDRDYQILFKNKILFDEECQKKLNKLRNNLV